MSVSPTFELPEQLPSASESRDFTLPLPLANCITLSQLHRLFPPPQNAWVVFSHTTFLSSSAYFSQISFLFPIKSPYGLQEKVMYQVPEISMLWLTYTCFPCWIGKRTETYSRKWNYLSAPCSNQLEEHKRCGNSSLRGSGVPLCSETKNTGVASRKRLHLWLQRQREDHNIGKSPGSIHKRGFFQFSNGVV